MLFIAASRGMNSVPRGLQVLRRSFNIQHYDVPARLSESAEDIVYAATSGQCTAAQLDR